MVAVELLCLASFLQSSNGEVPVDTQELASSVRDKRIAEHLTIRQAASQAGVSPSTLHRVERGERVRDYESLVRIARWAGVLLEESTTSDTEPGQPLSTSETVARVLRADGSLSPEDVEALMASFRAVYDRLRRRSNE